MRHARRDDHEVGPLEVGEVVAAERAPDVRAIERCQRAGELPLRAPVGDGDARPLAGAEPRGGDAAPREPDDGDALPSQIRRHGYLSFKDSRATRASMIDMIQNRTMIFGSAQPLSS